MTYTLIAPSIAAIVWAFVWLQRERDKKLSDAAQAAIGAHAMALEEQDIQLRALTARMNENEKHIGQLTDRALR
jgi:hypothetical protein